MAETSTGAPRYQEHPLPGGGTAITAAAAISVLLILLALVVNNDGLRAVLLVGGLLVGPIVVLTLYSMVRYNKIELHDDRLVVGRDNTSLTDLDPVYGVRPAEEVLDRSTRDSLEVGVSPKRGDLRIMGRSWGRPKNGSEFVVVRDQSGGLHAIATRDAGSFTRALMLGLNDHGSA